MSRAVGPDSGADRDLPDAGAVDFVVGDPDGGFDEELAQPARRELPGTPRLRWAVGSVAVALIVVAGVLRAQSAPHHPAAANATTTPGRTTSVSPMHTTALGRSPGVFVPLPGRTGETRNDVEMLLPALGAPPACPATGGGRPVCITTRSMPSAFLAAVRSQFPGAGQVDAVTQLLRPVDARPSSGLWSRTFTGHAGGSTIVVLVRLGNDPNPVGEDAVDDGNRTIVYSEHQVDRYTVEVEVSAPSGHAPSLRRVDRLAADARLTRS
jgi:hypothetical protein